MNIRKIKFKLDNLKVTIISVLMTVLTSVYAYADTDGVTQFDNVLGWILSWIQKIGIVLAVWGAVQIALSFSNEDANQRRNGILQFISGLMVMAIGFGAKTIIGY